MTTQFDEIVAPPPKGAWKREPVRAPLRADSLLRRHASEPVLLAGAQRALLLQLAHPKVATGVDDHSGFRTTPVRRLFGTADKVGTMVWGDGLEPQAAWEAVMAVHDRVNGELHDAAGNHDAGAVYTAHDPRLLLWVWATLVDTIEVVVERYIAAFQPGEREELYADWLEFARFFGIPDEIVPADREAFGVYWRGMLEGDELGVGATGHRVAKSIVDPPVPLAPRPLKATMATIAVGLLPERVRDMYGFEWDTRRERRFRRIDSTLRAVYPRLPALRRSAPVIWMNAKRLVSPRWRGLSRA